VVANNNPGPGPHGIYQWLWHDPRRFRAFSQHVPSDATVYSIYSRYMPRFVVTSREVNAAILAGLILTVFGLGSVLTDFGELADALSVVLTSVGLVLCVGTAVWDNAREGEVPPKGTRPSSRSGK
jgi:hypothetical protein